MKLVWKVAKWGGNYSFRFQIALWFKQLRRVFKCFKKGKGFSNYLTLVKYTPHQVSLRGNLTTQKKSFIWWGSKSFRCFLKNKTMLSLTFKIYITSAFVRAFGWKEKFWLINHWEVLPYGLQKSDLLPQGSSQSSSESISISLTHSATWSASSSLSGPGSISSASGPLQASS